MEYKEIKRFLSEQDHFVKEIGIKIEKMREGYAKVRMDLSPMHFNANGFVNGGALYTLADFAGVCAASSYRNKITTVTGNINYLKGVRNVDRVYGLARVIKKGKQIIDIEAKIVDDDNTIYMQSSLTFFILSSDQN